MKDIIVGNEKIQLRNMKLFPETLSETKVATHRFNSKRIRNHAIEIKRIKEKQTIFDIKAFLTIVKSDRICFFSHQNKYWKNHIQ